MSEISILDRQYRQLVDISDKVNNSVIAYKKRILLSEAATRQQHPKLSVSAEEVHQAKEILLPFLESLQQLLDDQGKSSEYIPAAVLADYKKKLVAKPFIKEELDELIGLLTNDQGITAKAVSILDGIMSLLDSERSILFRKLRTARG